MFETFNCIYYLNLGNDMSDEEVNKLFAEDDGWKKFGSLRYHLERKGLI
jgi:hypothetical protein